MIKKLPVMVFFVAASLWFTEKTAASEFYFSGDTLCISDSLIPQDTLAQIIVLENAGDSLTAKLTAEKFRFIRIGKKLIKNPVYSLFQVRDKNRAVAIALAILTGPLGGHRLYLGTKPIVPVVYALTLGGGFFILPFIDIVVLLFSKDISRFENNDKIFMWVKE
jgi:TM2 domain-containing membrane protein YozV